MLKIVNTPDKNLVSSNHVYVCSNTVDMQKYIMLKNSHIFITRRHAKIAPGQVGVNQIQRQSMHASNGEMINYSYVKEESISTAIILTIEIDFLKSTCVLSPEIDGPSFMQYFRETYEEQIFARGQKLICDFHGNYILVKIANIDNDLLHGKFIDETEINLIPAKKSIMKIANLPAGRDIFNTKFTFSELGIGGLDSQLNNIFRRAFASRIYPRHIIEKLGIEHIRGIILYGPPGTGKTLIARQIGKILNCIEPKIINGPEILNKYVGQSEENIRNLFKDAENDDGENLHLIIFDEIDAVCKKRGSGVSAGAGDSVVNQLLSKIDGVSALNNVLIIGMTNRLDMLDGALLRPGRFEIQIEIGLPDEIGRMQILQIHTRVMKQNGYLADDVSLAEIAKSIKNYSGAEIAGLVKSASSFALNGNIDINDIKQVSKNAEIRVRHADFENAISEVPSAFGANADELELYMGRGLINYGPPFSALMKECYGLISKLQDSPQIDLLSILLHGAPGVGKTAIAAHLAQGSEFPYIKIVSADSMIAMSDYQVSAEIGAIFADAYKSPHSIIILDGIERLIQYTELGPRFSNGILQTILVLSKKPAPRGRKLLIIGTTNIDYKKIGLHNVFNFPIEVPQISDAAYVQNIFPGEKSADAKLPASIKQLLLDAEMRDN